uniref:Uncharacterized protein n=1 Tax=candidate division WOR-3 bacterium TaxID=2052148 RepID=A0A7C2K2K2_UNCW3
MPDLRDEVIKAEAAIKELAKELGKEQELVKKIEEAKKQLENVAIALENKRRELENILDQIKKLSDSVHQGTQKLEKSARELLPNISQLLDDFKREQQKWLENSNADLKENLIKVERVVKDLFENLDKDFKTKISEIKEQIGSVDDFIRNQSEKLFLQLERHQVDLKTVTKDLLESLDNNLKVSLSEIKNQNKLLNDLIADYSKRFSFRLDRHQVDLKRISNLALIALVFSIGSFLGIVIIILKVLGIF